MSKQELGQFFTTNYEYILQNLTVPDGVQVIEPFAGNGDLIQFITGNSMPDKNEIEHKTIEHKTIEHYDIDPKLPDTIKRDTILNPPNYANKFVCTNPPYLARNKAQNKRAFDKYGVNDLYKCFICEIIAQSCVGGILIIPLNFWSSIRDSDVKLRRRFVLKYNVLRLNIFEEQVFDDTTTTVCAFQFERRRQKLPYKMHIYIYPAQKTITATLSKSNNHTIGGGIYNLHIPPEPRFSVSRLTSKNADYDHTSIKVKCIDDNQSNMISLIYAPDDIFIDNTPKLSARTYATLVIEPSINIEDQKKLCRKFNSFLRAYRNKYHSLFLSNYRESKDIARKRISFGLVYHIVAYLLEKYFFN
jgi:hypothetical protein